MTRTQVIEGVEVSNPTAVWMQLKNARHNVLASKDKWNPGGWYEAGGRKMFTMCLANAVRFVARGTANEPGRYEYKNDTDLEVAEQIILRAIPLAMNQTFDDIPAFNDNDQRRFAEVVAVLDKAIEMVAPHAKADVTTLADDVMTPEELAEIRAATWKAEDDIWDEYRKQYKVRFDTKGRWRTATGKFATTPPAVRRQRMPLSAWLPQPKPKLKDERQVQEFKLWLDDHEERGWDTFWDDLLECDAHDPDYEACEAAKKALALA